MLSLVEGRERSGVDGNDEQVEQEGSTSNVVGKGIDPRIGGQEEGQELRKEER